MPSTNSLLRQLQSSYPDLAFKPSDSFAWSSSEQTVYYAKQSDPAYLLHEVAHALLGHSSYNRDIDLLKMERDAWDLAASELAPRHKIEVNDDLIQDSLDTYRDWLHSRSLCPRCSSTGYQTKRSIYSCPACQSDWRVNEARTCGLRRYRL